MYSFHSNLTSRLFETDNENLERMLFNYKYRLNSMMNYLFAHENEFDFPKKFFILSIIQAILDCKDSEKAPKNKGSPKPKLPFDFFSEFVCYIDKTDLYFCFLLF